MLKSLVEFPFSQMESDIEEEYGTHIEKDEKVDFLYEKIKKRNYAIFRKESLDESIKDHIAFMEPYVKYEATQIILMEDYVIFLEEYRMKLPKLSKKKEIRMKKLKRIDNILSGIILYIVLSLMCVWFIYMLAIK